MTNERRLKSRLFLCHFVRFFGKILYIQALRRVGM